MGSKEDKLMEAQVMKMVRRAWRRLSEMTNGEPRTLVIESGEAPADVSDETAAEIRTFLFKRG